METGFSSNGFQSAILHNGIRVTKESRKQNMQRGKILTILIGEFGRRLTTGEPLIYWRTAYQGALPDASGSAGLAPQIL